MHFALVSMFIKKLLPYTSKYTETYNSVWRDCLCYKLWDMGVTGRMWHVIMKMNECSKSVILLEREKSDASKVEQGVAHGCSFYPPY